MDEFCTEIWDRKMQNNEKIIRVYRVPGVHPFRKKLLLDRSKESHLGIDDLDTETCFMIGLHGENLNEKEWKILSWLLSETFEPENYSKSSLLVMMGIFP